MTPTPSSAPDVSERIRSIREQRVILDFDLAELYGLPTKRFNEAFKRSRNRIPPDFAFQLTPQEFAVFKTQLARNWSQSATSSIQTVDNLPYASNSSQAPRCSLPPVGLQRTRRAHGGQGAAGLIIFPW